MLLGLGRSRFPEPAPRPVRSQRHPRTLRTDTGWLAQMEGSSASALRHFSARLEISPSRDPLWASSRRETTAATGWTPRMAVSLALVTRGSTAPFLDLDFGRLVRGYLTA